MAKNSGRRIFKKEKVAEDWCFQCKDGGELMICDHGGCLKAYHPECAGVEDSVLTSDEPWICGRHACLICKGKSYYQCYCCDRASCWSCIGEIDFVHLKGRNGLCNNCLKLALLVEENRNIDSDGEIADFRDRETYECLFREYYELVKEKEGIDKNKLLAGKAQLDKEKRCQISSYSNKRCEKEDEQFSSGNKNFNDGEPKKKKLKMKRCTQQKTKTQSKVIGSLEQNKLSSIWYSTAPKSQFAALIPENIKLVYLRRSLVMELIKQPESIKTKIIGSFVLVKLDPQRNSHQLVQITGVFSGAKLGSSDTCNSESSIQVSNVATDVSLTMLSDNDIFEEDCDVLRKNVKAGLQKKLTIVELDQRAKILHEDITKHRIARELKVLQGKIDQANEKGWRQELTKHLNRRYLLQQDSYLSSVLENIPRVTPEEIEPVSLDGNDNQIVTTIKKNITGVTPEKIDSEPLAENDDGKLSSDNGDFSGGGPPKKGDEKKTYTQQKTKMQRRDTSQKKEFVGWGSKSLIDFLHFIGHDTREKLSPYDVTSMVIKYANENDLIHPIEKKKILCDIQLEALLGGKVVNKDKILSLLISHFVENEERLQKNELDHDLEDNDTEMFVASKTEKKVEQNKSSSIWYSTAAQSQFAALIPENIKLVYLKRSLVLEMIKKPESFETKIIGSFVRVKLDPRDFELRNSHQLVQITASVSGIQPVSSDNCCCKSSIQVSNIAKNVCLNTLSDDEFSNEECDEFRKKVKDGIFKKLTVVELEQRAKILHEDITNHRIARELKVLQGKIDQANEKGWRQELTKHLNRRYHLQQDSYLSSVLENIPRVTPEEIEPVSLDRNDNQIVTTIKKNITGVTPGKIDSEPLAENDDGKLSSDNGDFSGEGPPKKGDEKKTYTQQKTKMQRRDTSQKKEFVGWGSKSLIDFLQFIGHDTREKLSPYDVTSMVIKYVNENDLIHPIENRKILCDIQLEALFGGKVVNRDIILSLLISHFVENEERLQKNELDHDLEDNDTEMFVASKTEKKVEQNKRSSIWYSTAAQSQFAALIPENIKLVYLKRSLVLEMIKKPESFETKIIGSFVRVKLDPRDFELRNSHQLVQITGIQPVSSDNCCCKSSIQVSNIAKNVCLNTLSDDEFSNEECDEFRKKVKDGIFKKLTVVELEQRAKILHEDITNHRIARELELALQNIPKVIPEEVESLDGDDNQMHVCSDEATLQNKIILE
ncbi:uncharacterized protein LOC107007277 isoform X4 [Solanum pennellii]|uniref:Uncharacterized protein LOC107007277 isoform X4 n=1 Tax=Solanum pennellii TaxID=28526 RepID=A0ABM1VDG4_SOLPN|nr:uncharacterized protein LOC107007277 isoform X4 [Solanum pennellii]